MSIRLGLVALFVCGVLVAAGYFLLEPTDSRGGVERARGATPERSSEAAADVAATDVTERSTTLAAREPEGEPSQSTAPVAPTAKRQVEGRVLDVTGAPLVDVAMFADMGKKVAQSAADGGFRFETNVERSQLVGVRDGFVTVRAAIVSHLHPTRDALVVMAPAVDLAGRVVDPEGEGVGEALLEIEDDWQGVIGFPLPLDGTEPVRAQDQTNLDGTFDWKRVPRLPERPLMARRSGFRTAALDVPEVSTSDIVIRLERTVFGDASKLPTVFGVVTFPDGSPAEGAEVRLGQSKTTTDRDGRFELPRRAWTPDDTILIAMLRGWQPAVWGEIGPAPEEAMRVGPLALTLPGRSLAISGRVELSNGKPAEGWRVVLKDPTVIDHNNNPPPTTENLGDPFSSLVRTDERGRFEANELADRAYTLRFWHPETYVVFELGPIPAGAVDVVARVPEDAVVERLVGRVFARGGVPIVGAHVVLVFVVSSTRTGAITETAGRAVSDANGQFELLNVPRRHVGLSVGGEDLVWTSYTPPGGEFDGRAVEIEVERIAHVRLDFSSANPQPDTFRMLDEAGEQLMIESRSADGRTSTSEASLIGGRSAVLSVGESAATLVLLRNDEELSRRALQLVGGTVNELGP